VAVIHLLLQDPRVDVTLPDINGCTPLWWASYRGWYDVIEALVASGKDLGDLNKKGIFWEDFNEYSSVEIAREKGKTEAVELLERFMANPRQTRHEVRVKLGVLDELAAEIFALTVFLCDDFLQIKLSNQATAAANTTTPPPTTTITSIDLITTGGGGGGGAVRYFSIARRLPMELQMILSHRVFDSMKQNIRLVDSEGAFKSLARILLLS